MRNCVAVVALLGLAGCTSDWDSGRKIGMGPTGHGAPSGSSHTDKAPFVARSSVPGSFASLPDRGELAIYDATHKPRISGAYSAYPVRLSEQHALGAARIGGQLFIKAPNGETIELAYERHVEHPDGNWTWIGRDASGADAVITFGEKAAFGTIPVTGDEALRLTTSQGVSWLVTTDRNKVADTDHAVTGEAKTDYVIPPKLAASVAARDAVTAATGEMLSASAAAASTTTIDVVLGYTTGLAAALGGQSQANTRLNNLVDIANQGYANSGISARLQLVATVSVNYRDDSDNGDTLEKLSGFNNSGPITPDPAFAGLRAARDTHGADLVSLVRDFRTPQNNGCGIAWLIGGGGDPIVQADAPYGYAVVSDGSDVDEGDGQTYFCRDESLAHEMGHNMGQAHNQEDSSSSGAHPYSYGYRETTTNGFYTIMAYRLTGSSQFAIRHFANPAIQYSGRPTGIAGNSDNALSMNQTMPIIATFRASVTPSSIVPLYDARRLDIDGDGRADFAWRNAAVTHLAYWRMVGANLAGSGSFLKDASWRVLGSGDFNGDGRADIIWTNGQQMEMWVGDGASFSTQSLGAYPTGWQLAGVGDIDGNGRADLFWRLESGAHVAYWLMNGAAVVSSWSSSASPDWRILGTGDFNADNRLDLVWTNGSAMVMWQGASGGNFAGLAMPGYPVGWDLAGVGDVNGDGRADLLWRNQPRTHLSYWVMQGSQLTGAQAFEVGAAWRVVASGDYNGDGKLDIAWTNESAMVLWQSTGVAFTGLALPNYPVGWSAIGR